MKLRKVTLVAAALLAAALVAVGTAGSAYAAAGDKKVEVIKGV
ncbi:hypothetical protein [Streptomyces qinzhouensis]|nr:hypothetical protein [Streptomyces qinzhouensis]